MGLSEGDLIGEILGTNRVIRLNSKVYNYVQNEINIYE